MATELIAVGTTAANSADIVVAAGEVATIGLKVDAGSDAQVQIQLKDAGGGYNLIGYVGTREGAKAITAPGTYRIVRKAGVSCGVFRG